MNKKAQNIIKYVDQSGEEFTISLDFVKPLFFEDIQKVIKKENQSFNIEISGNEIINPPDDNQINKNLTLSTNITFHRKPKVFCLIKGGWLPPALINNSTFLADKNIVIILKKFEAGSKRLDHESTNWWLQLPSKIKINPILFAMEGNNQESPNFHQFCEQFNLASKNLKSIIPDSEIIEFSDIHYKASYDHVSMQQEKEQKHTKFLKEVSRDLVNRHSDKNLDTIKHKILSVAKEIGVSRQSLVVILALACIYENKDGSGLLAARRILKPSKSYSSKNAFNTISDLRSIEFLIASICYDLKPRASLVTCDIGIAGLWCALNPIAFNSIQGRPVFSFSLNQHLFPRLNPTEINSLIEEIKEDR